MSHREGVKGKDLAVGSEDGSELLLISATKVEALLTGDQAQNLRVTERKVRER